MICRHLHGKVFSEKSHFCKECREFQKVVTRRKPWNGCKLYDPEEKLGRNRTLFLSEAPPLSDTFFQCNESDQLRKNLFEGVNLVFGKNIFTDLESFFRQNCYLLPSYSYACGANGRNLNPDRYMITSSAKHMSRIVNYIEPNRVVLLGKRALWLAFELGLVKEDNNRTMLSYISENPHGTSPRTYVTYWPRKRFPDRWRVFLKTMRRLRSDGFLA